MARVNWKEGNVVSVRLKDGSFVLAQMLKQPFVVFFDAFQETDEWPATAAEGARPLFFCSITAQFRKLTPIARKSNVRPAVFSKKPCHWIRSFPGSRKVTVYPGTPLERTFIDIAARPGGQLIEMHIDASGFADWPVIMPSIPLDDDETIDGHEMNVIWTFPLLNERLLLCKTLGRCVDPAKDLTFDRPMLPEYEAVVDIMSNAKTLEELGYSRAR
jgi:hypothetical protein